MATFSASNLFRGSALALTLAVGGLGGGAVTFTATPAQAVPVYDAANHTQNILTAVRALEQITNQIEQIQNQIHQIENQALMLESIGADYAGSLTNLANKTKQYMNASEAIAFNLTQINQDFAELYPEDWSGGEWDAMMQTVEHQRRANAEAARTAMRVASRIQSNNDSRRQSVSNAKAASQSAVGQTQALQATNQLLAVLTEQIADLTALIEAQGRVEQQLAAERANREAMQSELNDQFWSNRHGDPQSIEVGDLTKNN